LETTMNARYAKLMGKLTLVPFLAIVSVDSVSAQAWPPAPFSEAALHSFGAADGAAPQYMALLADGTGALYGTASSGGANNTGVVFKLTPPAAGQTQWTETVIYNFSSSGAEGAGPYSGVVMGANGTLFGVTRGGGANGVGAAFKLAPPIPPSTQWSYTKIFDFSSALGGVPIGAPAFDGAGALIGVANTGGAAGYGSIYKLTPPTTSGTLWSGAALYNFAGGADGSHPLATPVADPSGTMYGTAYQGGSGYGVVYQLTPPGANCAPSSPNLWCQTVIHTFSAGDDGGLPSAGLAIDAYGTLYGTASAGGASGKGVAFSLTPPVPPSTQWVETVLHSFSGGQDGAAPYSPLTLASGVLYGATVSGGGSGCGGGGCGTLFQILPPAAPTMHWTETTLYRFTGGADGGKPVGGLIFGAPRLGFGAALYGACNAGGSSGQGAIYTLQCAKPAREVFGGAQHAACAQ
jgi:uncharacterized repeat protein (TIGR03803 family)